MDALLAIADAVDELAERPVDPIADPWAGWGKGEATQATPSTVDKSGVEAEIAELESRLHGCEDPEESKVLRAQIDLKKDDLIDRPPPAEQALEQRRTVSVDNGGELVIEVPEATEAEKEVRKEFLANALFPAMEDHYGNEAAALYAESYIKGGPLLLYYTDRDFVNALPDQMKHVMVGDVEHFSPNEAAEMARDILKDLSPGTERKDIMLEANLRAEGNL
jgi:hypothetical protein